MNEIYQIAGISKQGFHQRTDYYLIQLEEQALLLPLIHDIRRDHPDMSSRQMYRLIKPTTLGRDRFERFCFENGFKLQRKANFTKTTDSTGVVRFDNLIKDLELTGVNQLWASDITYYRIREEFYFLVFIIDVFSRHIVGYKVSSFLKTTSTTLPALRMALRLRRGQKLEGLIFHSDGGGQYYCKEFLSITQQYKFRNSMCLNPWDNPHAERINGIIKNKYLQHYNPQNFMELRKQTKRAVWMYNNQKPHEALKGMSPVTFEAALLMKSTKFAVVNKRKKEAKKEKMTTMTMS